jgi:hypothetical protein
VRYPDKISFVIGSDCRPVIERVAKNGNVTQSEVMRRALALGLTVLERETVVDDPRTAGPVGAATTAAL